MVVWGSTRENESVMTSTRPAVRVTLPLKTTGPTLPPAKSTGSATMTEPLFLEAVADVLAGFVAAVVESTLENLCEPVVWEVAMPVLNEPKVVPGNAVEFKAT